MACCHAFFTNCILCDFPEANDFGKLMSHASVLISNASYKSLFQLLHSQRHSVCCISKQLDEAFKSCLVLRRQCLHTVLRDFRLDRLSICNVTLKQ